MELIRMAGLPTTIAGLHYNRVVPQACYAPWMGDVEFQEIYGRIRNDTFVDEYRCFELWQLVDYAQRIAGDIIEVGVWRGGTGAVIAMMARKCSPQKRVYLCDTFSGVVKASAKDPAYRGGEHANTSEGRVRDLITSLGLNNISVVPGIFPDESGSRIEAQKLSFVHIDVDVYDSARDVMNYVWPRMPAGAVVVFDDYGFLRCGGIARLVDGYRNDADKLVIHNLNGHAIIVKVASS